MNILIRRAGKFYLPACMLTCCGLSQNGVPDCYDRDSVTEGGNAMICYLAMLDSEEDKDKFTLLYELYSQPMFYIAKQILKDVQGAEDCVHDAFLKILHNMDKVGKAEDARTRSFVFIIVRNTAINVYRMRKRKEHVSISDEMAWNLPQLWMYDRYDLGARGELEEILLKISPIYRDILTLKYIEEYSNGEIGELLGITEATVRKRMERARKCLARAWEGVDGCEK